MGYQRQQMIYLCFLQKNDQIKVSQETENESNTGFGHALMPSYIAMHSQKEAFFFRFWKQP